MKILLIVDDTLLVKAERQAAGEANPFHRTP